MVFKGGIGQMREKIKEQSVYKLTYVLENKMKIIKYNSKL